MIKSMTGFGRCEIQKESRKFTVELKSVNHRYLDVNIRMPKKLNFFETAIRYAVKAVCQPWARLTFSFPVRIRHEQQVIAEV